MFIQSRLQQYFIKIFQHAHEKMKRKIFPKPFDKKIIFILYNFIIHIVY